MKLQGREKDQSHDADQYLRVLAEASNLLPTKPFRAILEDLMSQLIFNNPSIWSDIGINSTK